MGFRRLGMAYEDSVNGRSYAAIDAVEAVARERGFEIVRCHTKTDIADVEEAEQTVLKCFDELGENAGVENAPEEVLRSGVISAFDDQNLDIRPGEGQRGGNPRETGADDDDFETLAGHIRDNPGEGVTVPTIAL